MMIIVIVEGFPFAVYIPVYIVDLIWLSLHTAYIWTVAGVYCPHVVELTTSTWSVVCNRWMLIAFIVFWVSTCPQSPDYFVIIKHFHGQCCVTKNCPSRRLGRTHSFLKPPLVTSHVTCLSDSEGESVQHSLTAHAEVYHTKQFGTF